MRTPLLAGTALLALAASVATASAVPTAFTYTGGFQAFTAPVDGVYDILALGAQGGGSSGDAGGLGAEIGGDFTLTAGEMLRIAVGGSGGGNFTGVGAAAAASWSRQAARPW